MAEKIVSQRLGQYDVNRNPYAKTFPHLVHTLIERLLSDDILDAASKRVTEISLEKGETEDNSSDRIIEGIYQCANVFSDHHVVEEYLRGLTPAISRVVREKLKQLPLRDSDNLAVVRQLVVFEGHAHRARMEALQKVIAPERT